MQALFEKIFVVVVAVGLSVVWGGTEEEGEEHTMPKVAPPPPPDPAAEPKGCR